MTPTNQNPRWWQLYVLLPVLVALFLPEEKAALTETEHVIAELALVFLIFGVVQLWLRANRSALMHQGEQQRYWQVNVHHFPPESLVSRDDMMEEEWPARPMLEIPTSEMKGVLGTTFEWPAPEDGTSVFANRRVVRRKE